jgi:hypothetical protein
MSVMSTFSLYMSAVICSSHLKETDAHHCENLVHLAFTRIA